MKYAETALLLAVRAVLRMPVDQRGAAFKDHEAQIEADEIAPATAGDTYLALMPGGVRPGPRHNTSGGVFDLLYGVDILVINRVGNVPRDRYAAQVASLNDECDRVLSTIDFDFSYLVNRTANQLIEKKTGSTEGFVEPLKFAGCDPKPRIANAEIFGGQGGHSGLVRKISLFGARRITTRS